VSDTPPVPPAPTVETPQRTVETPIPTVEAPAVDETVEPEGEAKEEATSRTVVRSLAALAIVFFVGTVVAAIFAASQHRQLQQSKDARAGVEQVASRYMSALLTYDYRDLDKTKRSVLALSTGKFRTDFEQNFSGLAALFTTTKAQSTATIKDVFVSSIDHDTATAIVVFDQRSQGTSGSRLNLDGYVRASLVKVQGGWRVDDLMNISPPGQAPTPTPGTSVPTTAPPK
jgi:hypothetical protein